MAETNPVLQQLQKLKKVASDARTPFDKDVWLNVSFFLDEQYVEWAADSRNIREVPRKSGFENAPRPVVNKIMHFVAQEHAFALKSKPTVDVLPATDDPVDIYMANPALAYLRWLTEPQVNDWDRELSDATLWALAGGEGFIKWTFDPKLKRPVFTSVSPLDLYFDPYAKQFSKARYAIHSQFMDPEQVYDIYGKEVRPTEVQRTDAMRSALLRDMGSAPVQNGVEVNELWMLPSRRHPDGLFVVWTGNDILYGPEKFPYAHGKLPFTQIGSIPRPGSAHYTCAVKYMRSAQMELNKYHAQRIMIREAFANPKWWIPAELELETNPDDSPRQILRGHSQGGSLKPEIIQPTVMAGADEGQWIGNEMMNIVGLHEVSQGQVPGRVESARAIDLLRESDSDRLAELFRTTKAAISEGFWQTLMLARQYVSEEQIVQVYSRDGVPEVHRMKTENFKAGMRVRVTMGGGLGYSRAAREERVMRLIEVGVLKDPETIAELLDVPTGQISPAKVYDIRLARNENLTMAEGTPITPNTWDDHGIHLREHNNYRKTTEFLGLSAEDKTKFEYHCKQHEEFELHEMLKQAAKMAAVQQAQAGGQPPQQGGPMPAPPEPSSPQGAVTETTEPEPVRGA